MGFFDSAKDMGVQAALNHQLKGIGHLRHLDIDRKQRRITAELELHGEHEPIEVIVDGWELSEDSAQPRIRIRGFSSNRAWLNAVALRTIVNRWFDIPPEHAGKLKMALA